MHRLLSTALALAACATGAAAQGIPFTITSSCLGNTVFTLQAVPTSPTATAEGIQNLRWTGATGQDQLFGNWWWYRAPNDTREFAFNTGATSGFQGAVVSPKGDMAILRWSNVDGKGFDAQLTYRIYSTGTDSGVLSECMMIVNPTSAPLGIVLFNYTDFDVCGSFGGDTSNFVPPLFPPSRQQLINDAACTVRCYFLGCDVSAYQTGTFPAVRNLLTNATIDNLNDTGNPFGPGDWSSAYMWRVSVPAGGTATVYEALSCGKEIPCCDPAGVEAYCVGKAGTNGLPRWGDNPLFVCGQTELKVLNGLPGSSPVVLVGAARACIPLPPFGTLAVNPILVTFGMPPFNTSGVSAVCLTVPPNPGLCSVNLAMQAWFSDPGAAGFPVAHTEGCAFRIGSL